MVSGATQPVGRDHRLLPIADALGGNKQGDVLFFGTVERFRLQRFKVQTSDSCQKKKKFRLQRRRQSQKAYSAVSLKLRRRFQGWPLYEHKGKKKIEIDLRAPQVKVRQRLPLS